MTEPQNIPMTVMTVFFQQIEIQELKSRTVMKKVSPFYRHHRHCVTDQTIHKASRHD